VIGICLSIVEGQAAEPRELSASPDSQRDVAASPLLQPGFIATGNPIAVAPDTTNLSRRAISPPTNVPNYSEPPVGKQAAAIAIPDSPLDDEHDAANSDSGVRSLVGQLVAKQAQPADTGVNADLKIASFLLQPLYLTNVEPGSAPVGESASTNPVAPRVGEHDLTTTLRQSPLVQQLAFTNGGDLIDPSSAVAAGSNTALVAYLQEQPPAPVDLDIDSVEELVPAPARPNAEAEAARTDEADSLADAEQLGEEPVDRSLDFLRTETVLLEPGESQCDVGINYLLTETDFPILVVDDMDNIVAVDEASFRIRELSVPLEYRMGLLPRVQGFIGAPIGWSNTQLSLDAFDAFQNDGGLGDLDFGLTMQLVDASTNCPYVIGTIQTTAPTGGDPFTAAVGLAPTAPSLGQGFWSIAGNLLFIQPYDPVVVFYGLGTEQFFAREFVGLEIDPGAQYTYTFGVGFAVNERITLSTRFFGAYVDELEVDGQRRFGTNAEPHTIRLSATISQPCDRLVEPFVEFGITDDAISSFLGITWTFSPHSHRKPHEQASADGKK
jgi:hypothetical protein